MGLRRVAAIIALSCSALLLTSCLARRRVITRDKSTQPQALLTANKEALLKLIENQTRLIGSLSATVNMVPSVGSVIKGKITEYTDFLAYIRYRKPDDIRIIGLYPVVRNKAFDMVSDGKNFRLYLPSSNRFVIGSNELSAPSKNKIENLRPQHFLEALLVSPVQPGEKPELMNYTDEDNAAYILHLAHELPDGALTPSRSIWFNRFNLHMARQLVFDPAGNILTDARYSDWQNYDGIPFPKTIDITRPRDEYAVVLTVVKMEINRGVADDKFVLEQPEGTQLQVLGQPAPTPPAPPAPAQKKKKKKP